MGERTWASFNLSWVQLEIFLISLYSKANDILLCRWASWRGLSEFVATKFRQSAIYARIVGRESGHYDVNIFVQLICRISNCCIIVLIYLYSNIYAYL